MLKIIFWIGGLLVLGGLLILGYANSVYGDIRDEIDHAKKRINALEKENTVLIRDINKQKELILVYEKEVLTAKENEKKWRQEAVESWDAILTHEKSINSLNAAELKLKNANDTLQKLIDDRNILIKNINDLEKLIIELDKDTKKQPIINSKNGIVGIILDNNCLAHIKNNFTSDCPTYEEIALIYPNSECNMKGRACYDYFKQIGGFHYMINPNAEVIERVNLITIRNNFDEYLLKGVKGYNTTEHKLIFGLNRYVDDCRRAFVDSSSWITTTGDTIYFLNNDCDPKFTYIDTLREVQLLKIEHDIRTSMKYKLEQWQKEVKENCLDEFMKCGNSTTFKRFISDSVNTEDRL